jgi:peptidoglycan hydrolase CwlO-like protein
MPRPLSNSEPQRNGTNGDHAGRALPANPAPQRATSMNSMSSEDAQEYLQQDFGSVDPQEIEILRDENNQLRDLVAELERHLEDLTAQGADPQILAAQQKELESLLEEKSEIIRELHLKVQEQDLELKSHARPRPVLPHEDELMRMQEELDRERKQLQEDENSMMQQMREMEVQMARERAEMARQRTDLQRLHAEIRHELELAARDATLRERLAPLQRRHQDIMNRRGSSPAAAATPAQPAQQAPAQQPAAPQAPARKDSGLFRRLFR